MSRERSSEKSNRLAKASDDMQNLKEMLTSLKEESEARGLNINKKKTNVMVFRKIKTNPKCDLYCDLYTVEDLNRFKSLTIKGAF